MGEKPKAEAPQSLRPSYKNERCIYDDEQHDYQYAQEQREEPSPLAGLIPNPYAYGQANSTQQFSHTDKPNL